MTQAAQLAQYGANNVGLSFKNRLINGDMTIDQRNNGASVNAVGSGVFPVDRFIVGRDTSAAVMPTQRSTTSTSGFVNSLQVTISTSATPAAGDDNAIFHRIEGFNVADLGWGTANAQAVTISFWVRSSVTGTYGLSFANSAANRCFVSSYTVNSANTFEYKTVTIPGDTSGTWLTDNGIGLRINWDLGCGSSRSGSVTNAWGSTFVVGLTGGVKLIQNSGATFFITGVQLEKGTVATSFDYLPYGTELALCQRYYEVSGFFAVSGSSAIAGGAGNANNRAFAFAGNDFKVTKRVVPTMTFQSGQTGTAGRISGYSSGTEYTINDPNGTTITRAFMYLQTTTSMSSFEPQLYFWQASAEL